MDGSPTQSPSVSLRKVAVSSSDPDNWLTEIAAQSEQGTVVKIVLGNLGAGDAKDYTKIDVWLNTLAESCPALTHLYLWGISNITALPSLPTGLLCLDVRYCANLTTLPETLPEPLECLDLAYSGVERVPEPKVSKLKWFHVDSCATLRQSDVNNVLAASNALKEFTADGFTNLKSLTLPERAGQLRKLVLSGCSELGTLPADLSSYPSLQHLNINGCKKLEVLPPIPPRLQYLVMEGCERLKSFTPTEKSKKCYDIRPVHRSIHADDNRARLIKTYAACPGEPVELVMGKILILGSGRCGKTTLAKAIVWDSLEGDDREKSANQEFKPGSETENNKEISTHGIHFYPVTRGLRVNDEPKLGRLNLWDFGGQELYHQTHRYFASQGTLFIIVTTPQEEHEKRLQAEIDGNTDPQFDDKSYRKENTYRGLNYWLDYVAHALQEERKKAKPKAGSRKEHEDAGQGTVNSPEDANLIRNALQERVLVVIATKDVNNKLTQEIKQQAPHWNDVLNSIKVVGLPPRSDDLFAGAFKEVSAWISEKAGKAADDFGIKVPGLFKGAADFCEHQVTTGDKQRCVLTLEDWRDHLVAWKAQNGNGGLFARFDAKYLEPEILERLDEETKTQRILKLACDAIAQHFGRCDRLVYLDAKGGIDARILLDHRFGWDLAYALCNPKYDNRDRLLNLSTEPVPEGTFQGLVADAIRDITKEHATELANSQVSTNGRPTTAPERKSSVEKLIEEITPENATLAITIYEQIGLIRPFGQSWLLCDPSIQSKLTAELVNDLLRAWQAAALSNAGQPESINQSGVWRANGNALLGEADFRAVVEFIIDKIADTVPKTLFGDAKEERSGQHRVDSATYIAEPRIWHGGFQVVWTRQQKQSKRKVALRLEWAPDPDKGFQGGIRVQFLAETTHAETNFEAFRQLLATKYGPLAGFGEQGLEFTDRISVEDLENEPVELRFSLRGGGLRAWSEGATTEQKHDVAISYEAQSKQVVRLVRKFLIGKGITVFMASDGEDPADARPSVVQIYKLIDDARIVLAVPTEKYFNSQKDHCMTELADAIKKRKNRSEFFWLAVPPDSGDPYNLSDLSTHVDQALRVVRDRVQEEHGEDDLRVYQRRALNAVLDDSQVTRVFKDTFCSNPTDDKLKAESDGSLSKEDLNKILNTLGRPTLNAAQPNPPLPKP